MTALEYLCRLAVEAQHTAFRSQRGGFQSTASVQNRQGEDQALTLRANTFARSHRKLIFNLHHALHKTGHVPGIQIDCPGAHRPKTEHTRYTCLTPPASTGHRLTFLMTELINDGIRETEQYKLRPECSSSSSMLKKYFAHTSQRTTHSLPARSVPSRIILPRDASTTTTCVQLVQHHLKAFCSKMLAKRPTIY